MSKYPEHDKLTDEAKAENQAIANFLELANEKGYFLTEGANDGSTWTVGQHDIERVMAELHGIDYDAYQAEKQAAFDDVCRSAFAQENPSR